LLRGRSNRIWQAATRTAPAHALELTLRQTRLPDETDAGDSVVWCPAADLAAAPRRWIRLLGLTSHAWPRRLADDPILPNHVVPAARLDPYPVEKADRRHFAVIADAASEGLVLSRSRRNAQGGRVGPSPLLARSTGERSLSRARIPEHAFSEADRLMARPQSNVPPSEIAAITFTELAAGELRARISRYLDELLAGKTPEELELALPRGLSAGQRGALENARFHLDQLTCTTIHGFCHDLLRSYAVEAAVDPGADILDAVQADFAFDTIFERWWRRRLDEPRPPGDPIALVARRNPIRAEKLLRGFAEFRRDHRTARPLAPDIDGKTDVHFSECVLEFRRWFNAAQGPDQAKEDVIELEQLAAHFAGQFNPLPGFDQLWDLAHPPTLKIMRKDSLDLRPYQRRGVWQRAHRRNGSRLFDEAHAHYERCGDAFRTLVGRIATAIVSVFSAELNGLLEEYEAFKRHAAVLDFDDLLFTCRELLRQHPNVRRAAADRFRRILVDEFQDTGPVQCEIIFLLTSSGDDAGPWSERRLLAGRLFMVGDPKQAIYRFRGADLATYLQARRAIEAQSPGNILRIARNFRSRSAILEYINLCFAVPLAAQETGYVALGGTLGAAQHGLPCVAKMTVEIPPQTWVDGIRDEEARIVAETCARLIGNVKVRGSHGELRMLAPGDIALLAPAGRELWRYERALEEAGLPFVSQAGKNLFRRQEAQDVVALVRALADTRDTLALGALLRGPLVGLTEQELLDIAARLPAAEGGEDFPRLSLNTDPSVVQHAVARETLETLRDLRRRVRSTTPALLLSEAIERLRVCAIIMSRSLGQASRALANIDGLLERARVYGVRGFRQFARDLDDDWAGGAGHTEGALDAEGQAIEIVTIHSSKGLEWPIVIPINTPSQFRRPEQFVHRRSDDTLHWALGDVAPPSLSGAINAEGQEAAHERLRLLYVACTRAMDRFQSSGTIVSAAAQTSPIRLASSVLPTRARVGRTSDAVSDTTSIAVLSAE
jgi:CRISPR-associated exonuclease Cas4